MREVIWSYGGIDWVKYQSMRDNLKAGLQWGQTYDSLGGVKHRGRVVVVPQAFSVFLP